MAVFSLLVGRTAFFIILAVDEPSTIHDLIIIKYLASALPSLCLTDVRASTHWAFFFSGPSWGMLAILGCLSRITVHHVQGMGSLVNVWVSCGRDLQYLDSSQKEPREISQERRFPLESLCVQSMDHGSIAI